MGETAYMTKCMNQNSKCETILTLKTYRNVQTFVYLSEVFTYLVDNRSPLVAMMTRANAAHIFTPRLYEALRCFHSIQSQSSLFP